MKRIQSYDTQGFTLIELMIVVAIIGILSAVATASFISYRQKSVIATAYTSANSIRTSLATYSASKVSGNFPHIIESWSELKNVCNANGSTLREPAVDAGFIDWVDYTPIDIDGDDHPDDYILLLRVLGAPREKLGAQLLIKNTGITKQTY